MKTPRILVVEDEAVISRDIQQQLVKLGYDVAGSTPTGEDAVVFAGQLKPDLVLMDIHLAGKMDGIEAAHAIRKELGIPVVFLTAYAEAETLERAKVTEPFGYIIKPFEERHLHSVIEIGLFKHRAEGQLRRAYDEQATILRTALDGFLMADWQGRILDANESSCRMFGYSHDEFRRMSLLDLDLAGAKEKIGGLENLKQFEPTRFEREQRCKDGRTIFVEMSANYLPHAGGRIFCFVRDITDRKAGQEAMRRLNEELEIRVETRTRDLEAAKKEAEKASQAKSNFLATMTHELRTPLNSVIGILDLIQQTNLERDQVEMVELVTESASSLLALVDDILDFSKIEAGRVGVEVVPLSVPEVVERACSVLVLVAEKADVELTLFTDPKLPQKLLGDPTRLQQVLLNLANNAIKFSRVQQRPGRVSVRALMGVETADHASVGFEVKDNGIGMNEETLAGLFKPFTQGDSTITRRFGGTGLGLAICRNLVELMGGEITVTSEPGKGSTFRVLMTFPLPKERTAPAPVVGELAGASCLLVGEPEGLHNDLRAYLEAAGALVDEVPNLEMARLNAKRNAFGAQTWILDIQDQPPSHEALREAAGEKREPETRFVLIGRGRRRKPRVMSDGVLVIDANGMKRDTFLRAIAAASGRIDPMTATAAFTIRRTAPAPISREEAIRNRKLVLVAEDNEMNQKVIRRQLSLLGYAADVAPDGREALELWRTGDYSVLLTDLHMPEMDGYQLTAAIRVLEGEDQHGVIIALTADVLQGGAKECRDVGLDDYLCKPVRLSELKVMLEKWAPLGVRGPGPAESSGPAHPKPTEAGAGSPLDIAVLQDLVGSDPDVIRDFLRAFWITFAKVSSEIKAAGQEKQASLVAELAHKLKSPARSVGAMRLAGLCDELEQAGRASDTGALEKILPAFETESAEVEKYLRENWERADRR